MKHTYTQALAASLMIPLIIINGENSPQNYIMISIILLLLTSYDKLSLLNKKNNKTEFNIFLIIIFFILWCGVTSFWSQATGVLSGILRIFGWSSLGGITLLAFQHTPLPKMNRLTVGMALGIAIASCVILFISVTSRLDIDTTIDINSREIDFGSTFIASLIFPVIFLLKSNSKYMIFTILSITIIALTSTHMLAVKIALLAGGIIFLLTWLSPRLSILITGGIILITILSAPMIIVSLPPPEKSIQWQWLPSSAYHRLVIWDATTEKILQNPITGWGYHNSQKFSRQKEVVTIEHPSGEPLTLRLMPSHPHNANLQLWLETGAIGIGIFAFLLSSIFYYLYKSSASPAAKACVMATISVCYVISTVSFSFWESRWQLTLWLTTIFLSWIVTNSKEEKNL